MFITGTSVLFMCYHYLHVDVEYKLQFCTLTICCWITFSESPVSHHWSS